MTQQTDLKLIESKQVPLAFIASEPLETEAVIPTDPQAREQIRQTLLRWFAIQVAAAKLQQSQNQET